MAETILADASIQLGSFNSTIAGSYVVANRIFQGTTNTDFNTASNWDGGTVLPSAGDNIRISANCLMDANDANLYGTLLIDATKTFDTSTFDFSCAAVTIGGTYKSGTSAGTGLTCSGFTVSSGGKVDIQTGSKINNSGNLITPNEVWMTTANRGSYTQTGNGNYTSLNGNNNWYSFVNNAGVTITTTGTTTFTLYVADAFVNNGTINHGAYNLGIGAYGIFTIGANADFSGTGSLVFDIFGAATATWSKTTPISSTGTIEFRTHSNVSSIVMSRDLSNNSEVGIFGSSGGPTTVYMTSGTLKCKKLSVINNANQNIVFSNNTNNPSFYVSDNRDLNAGTGTYTTVWNKGTGTITIDGSTGTHTLDFPGLSVEAIVGAAAGTTKNIVSNFSTVSLSGVFGTLQSSSAGTQRVITCTNQGVLTGGSFKDISLGSASKCNAKSGCTNLGKNKGFVFKDTVMGCGE
jgi:hypothetical protein